MRRRCCRAVRMRSASQSRGLGPSDQPGSRPVCVTQVGQAALVVCRAAWVPRCVIEDGVAELSPAAATSGSGVALLESHRLLPRASALLLLEDGSLG